MTLSVVPKPTVADRIKADCIDILEQALERAKAGDVEAAVVILKHPDGGWSDERSGIIEFADMIGKIEIIKQSWIRHYLGQAK